MKNIGRIFSYRDTDYTRNKYNGKDCFEKENLKLINAKATDIDINELIGSKE